MNFKTRFYKPALLLLAASLFFAVGQMQSGLNADRKAMGLTKMDPLENAPPVLAFTTVALGGFRGLIANALWMRLNDMQLEDKYFDNVQLADWIVKLQPHMVAVWQFQAWNMAYNISVKFSNHEDRWQWVQRGIALLRDQGLELNPHETRLYRDLSWLFQHKVGANLDDAHRLYKLRWAQQMQVLFPTGQPNIKELINPDTPAWRERARKLREYHMDPKLIEKVDKEYGPFDWRLPDAYAVYYAELGRINARPEDQETLRRSIYQSLQQMAFRGGALDKSITNITDENFVLWPDLDKIKIKSDTYEKMIAEETNNPQGLQQNMETAHKNFLKQMIYELYVDGREGEALYWFNYVKHRYTNAFINEGSNISLDDYVLKPIKEDINETDQNKVTIAIVGMYDREFYWIAHGNYDHAANYKHMAEKIWKYYGSKLANGPSDVRLSLKPLGQYFQLALEKAMGPQSRFTEEQKKIILTTLGMTWPPASATANAPPPSTASATNTSAGP